MPIDQCLQFAQGLLDHEHTSLSEKEWQIGETILKEIVSRLEFLSAVGLNYLSLSREAGTLAGGEAQRIRLASQIGTGLSGCSLYLDEPTIGCTSDNQRLIQMFQNLRDKGNTVVVVEHDEEVIRAADYVFDFWPRCRSQRRFKIVAHGKPNEIQNAKESPTGQRFWQKQVKRKRKLIKW